MAENIQLTDGIILLRPPNILDVPAIHAAVTESLPELHPWLDWATDTYDEAAIRAWLEHAEQGWQHSTSYQFIITDSKSGLFVGGCKLDGVDEQNQRCNLGYWVRSSRAGQGIATRAVRLATRFAFETVGLILVEIVAAVKNEASQRVAQKAGAHYQGSLPKPMVVRTEEHNAVLYLLTPLDIKPKP